MLVSVPKTSHCSRDAINRAQHMFAKEIVAGRFGSVYKLSGGCIFTLSSYLLLVLEIVVARLESRASENTSTPSARGRSRGSHDSATGLRGTFQAGSDPTTPATQELIAVTI
jgi:hypothetical protein